MWGRAPMVYWKDVSMLVFKHAVSLSCLLAIASIMGLTFHTMLRQPPEQATLPTFKAQVATVGAATANSPSGSSVVTTLDAVPAAATPDTVAIPDAALTGAADTSTSTLLIAEEFSIAALEKQIHSRTNIIRSQNNLPALRYDAELAALARERSSDMQTSNYFSHTDRTGCDLSCRAKTFPFQTTNLGENLGEYLQYQSFSESELAALFVEMWLKSTSHRDHLFSNAFDREGIGLAIKGDRIVVAVLYAQ